MDGEAIMVSERKRISLGKCTIRGCNRRAHIELTFMVEDEHFQFCDYHWNMIVLRSLGVRK